MVQGQSHYLVLRLQLLCRAARRLSQLTHCLEQHTLCGHARVRPLLHLHICEMSVFIGILDSRKSNTYLTAMLVSPCAGC
jgi:hypothetical protein